MQPAILAMQTDGNGDHAARLLKQLSALLADADLDAGEFRIDLAAGPFRATVHVRMLPGSQDAGGAHLGELERRVVNVLAEAAVPLYGKHVGKRLGRDYDRDAKLKYTLQLLEERGVIAHTEAGYSLPDGEHGSAPVRPRPASRGGAAGAPAMLSDDEARVVAALRAAGEPLVGKEIAAAIPAPFDTKLRYLLLNLVRRGVLLHEDGKGYDVSPDTPLVDAPPRPQQPATFRERVLAFLAAHPGPHKPQSLVAGLALGMLSKVERDLLEGMVAEGVIRIEPGQGYCACHDADEQED